MHPPLTLTWLESGAQHSALWQTDNGARLPSRVQLVNALEADEAHKLASAGTGLLWRGDFQQAKQVLQGMSQRMDAAAQRKKAAPPASALAGFEAHRKAQALRVRVLGQLLIELDGDYRIALPRAPDVSQACLEAWGAPDGQRRVVPLRSLLGLIGAHEWRKKGVPIAALGGAHIHPHYGVFSPVRGEYVDLVANAPIKDKSLAFDIGVGTGVLSAVLAKRGVQRIVATDQDPRALACARENLQRLQRIDKVVLVQTDLFPEGQAPLIVCNPPWVPARPSSPIEHAVYDEGSRMLRGFLSGLREHLAPNGEGWLIMSDLAEHLELRTREELICWISEAGLKLVDRHDIKPRHGKATDETDPLHAARAKEVTSLWRLSSH